MEEMVTLKLPKKDVEAFLRVIEDIKFIEEAESGDEEINKGKFKTLDQIRKKYGTHK
ncbi:MAG: hypothetical protein HY929_02360 [Euryarchaeota archaeon]|nr:hypothetical protein [Euryarchaeota archaeon]